MSGACTCQPKAPLFLLETLPRSRLIRKEIETVIIYQRQPTDVITPLFWVFISNKEKKLQNTQDLEVKKPTLEIGRYTRIDTNPKRRRVLSMQKGFHIKSGNYRFSQKQQMEVYN